MNVIDSPTDTFSHFKQLEHDYIGYQSLTDVPKMIDCQEELKNYMVTTALRKHHKNYMYLFFSIMKINQHTKLWKQ